MSPVRVEHVIAVWLAVSVAAGVCVGAPQPDPTDAALRDAGMLDVLEARLLDELARAGEEEERSALIERLASVYTGMLRALPDPSPERRALVQRAWNLADQAGADQAADLRLALLLDAYLPIERGAELFELGLLDEQDRVDMVRTLRTVRVRLETMAKTAVVNAVSAERRARLVQDGSRDADMREAFRRRSLTNYYAGWAGLTLATLESRRPDNEVLPEFGWLLGGEGGMPVLDQVTDSSLGLEHVARSAIGVGRARAQSGDALIAEQWLRRVSQASTVKPEIRTQAAFRLIRFKADQNSWTEALALALEARRSGGAEEALPTPEARFLALRVLAWMKGDPRTTTAAADLGRVALSDLAARGEIGHVLELRKRFGGIPLLEDGFVGRYADALDALDRAEAEGLPKAFADAAARFGKAGKAGDASSFPVQQTDAALKQIYCELRAKRAAQAVALVKALLATGLSDQAREEARWLLIVALESTEDQRVKEELAGEIRAYVGDYPGTPRATKLLVRHAGTGVLDPGESVDELRAVGEDDPVALDARRVLLRLMYRTWAQNKRPAGPQRDELVGLVRWIWQRETQADVPPSPRQRLDTARIALDIAIAGRPRLDDLADDGLANAQRALDDDTSLAEFASEITLRRVELLASRGDLQGAETAARELQVAADKRADAADRAILAAAFSQLDEHPQDAHVNAVVVRVGGRVCDRVIPAPPKPLSMEASTIVDRVARAAATRWRAGRDETMGDMALRLGRVIIERGVPTAQGLRDIAALAADRRDARTELDAWSLLLAASKPDEEVWWEARYNTLRLLLRTDPVAARAAYEQHRVMFPVPGLLPWTTMIDDLFAPEKAAPEAGAP